MILVKLGPIKGDCEIDGYDEWVICSSCSWDIEREFSESGGKGGTADINLGVADLPPITFAKTMDKASVDLMQESIAGKSLGTVEIAFIESQSDGKTIKYLEFKLDKGIISGWSISASEDDRPEEEFKLWYAKIWMQYYTFDGKNVKAAGDKGWNRIKAAPWKP